MTPDWLQNLVPAGASRGKLMLATGSLVAALGVVAYDVVWMNSDDSVDHEGTVAALELGPADFAGAGGPTPAEDGGATARGVSATPEDRRAPEAASRTADGTAAASTKAPSGAASGAEPDWSALFAQLIARESALPLSSTGSQGSGTAGAALPDSELQARLDTIKLRGLVQSGAGSIALINDRMLRKGDTLPGTDFTLAGILDDRVLLNVPGRAALVTLLLEPMSDRPSAGAP